MPKQKKASKAGPLFDNTRHYTPRGMEMWVAALATARAFLKKAGAGDPTLLFDATLMLYQAVSFESASQAAGLALRRKSQSWTLKPAKGKEFRIKVAYKPPRKEKKD